MVLINSIKKQIKDKFDKENNYCSDKKGYVSCPQKNLIPGVIYERFEEDLKEGAGKELKGKFCAVHSSCALAVNTFGFLKNNPEKLVLLKQTGFKPPIFEHALPSGLKGIPPTPDVFLKCRHEAVIIESKYLEYFTFVKPSFLASYDRFLNKI